MNDIKISNLSGKYITANSELKDIKLTSKNKSNSQVVSYSAQGELIIGNKCVTYPSGSENPLYLTDCVGDDKQKWDIKGNSIRPITDSNKCVAFHYDEITTTQCNESDDQTWQTEFSDESNDSFKWSDYFGKTVVLVEADDPWYLNKDTTIPMEYAKTQELSGDISYRNHADYKTSKILDPTSPTLGMGYSYADRQGQPCKKIEAFNEGEKDSSNILSLLLFIIILIFVYKYFVQLRQ